MSPAAPFFWTRLLDSFIPPPLALTSRFRLSCIVTFGVRAGGGRGGQGLGRLTVRCISLAHGRALIPCLLALLSVI